MTNRRLTRTDFHLSDRDWQRIYPNRRARRPHFDHWTKLSGPAPCFYFATCKAFAVIAKDGKGVCRGCAENMTATMPHRQEYPLETYKLDVRKALALFAAARGEMHMPLKRLGHGSG